MTRAALEAEAAAAEQALSAARGELRDVHRRFAAALTSEALSLPCRRTQDALSRAVLVAELRVVDSERRAYAAREAVEFVRTAKLASEQAAVAPARS